MTSEPREPPSPSWRALQQGGRHGGGNRILVREGPEAPALLKLYRPRGPLWREVLKRLTTGIERRRGVTAEQRCALERECLALWRESGCDVPALLDRPLPAGLDSRTASWIEYCPGRLLTELLADPAVARAEKLRLVERLAREAGSRHALAFERRDPRLLLENASLKHVIVCRERLVHIDLEHTFDRGIDLVDALARELSTALRSLRRHAPADFETLASHFVRAYPDPALLRRAARYGALGPSWISRLRRWRDRHRRAPGTAKADMLQWVLRVLDDRSEPEQRRGATPPRAADPSRSC